MESTRHRLLIGTEIAGGAVSGIALGILGMVIGRQLGLQTAPGNGWSDLVGAVTGAGGGYLLGVVAGTTLVSRHYPGHGSFFACYSGFVRVVMPSSGRSGFAWRRHRRSRSDVALAPPAPRIESS